MVQQMGAVLGVLRDRMTPEKQKETYRYKSEKEQLPILNSQDRRV
jgi:hypothetical protein